MEGEEAGVPVGRLVGLHDGPDDSSVGVGEGEGLDVGGVVPLEVALADGLGGDGDVAEDAEPEDEPVSGVLEGAFGDHSDEADAVDRDVDSGLFEDFPLGAVCG